MTSISDTNVVNAPGGLVELGQNSTDRTNVAVTGTSTSNATELVATTIVCDGSPIIIEFQCGMSVTNGEYLSFGVWIDGVYTTTFEGSLAVAGRSPISAWSRLVPTAGAKTISIRWWKWSGSTSTSYIEGMCRVRVSKIIQASQLIVQTPNAPLVTSLPSNAIDGQEVRYLADNTNGIVWNLRYRAGSSSSYKWEFIGGPPMNANYQGGVYSAGTTWAALGANTNMSLPLAGDYDIKFGGYAYPAVNGVVVGLSPNATGLTAPNGTTGTANESGIFVDGSANAIQNRVQLAGYYRAKGISGTLSLYGYASTNSTSIYRPYIIATPVRVTA